MGKRATLACVLAVTAAGVSGMARAQPPDPITAELFAFPGAVPGPGSGRSAGLALADRWLGDEPFFNPAVRARAVAVAPALLRVSRQDLRAGNQRYDEQPFFLDAAGAQLAYTVAGAAAGAYAFQPVVRLEDNAFERGERGGPDLPAVIQTRATAREARAGVWVSAGRGPLRIGGAAEWTHRDDDYRVLEQSGSPDEGERRIRFSGGGLGFQGGARLDVGPEGAGRLSVGAALRFVPPLTLTGEQQIATRLTDTVRPVRAEREAAWQGGLSARYAVTGAFRVVAGVGGHGPQGWRGFDVASGVASMWSVAGEFHDARDPWTLRVGLGRERHEGVAESRAGVVAVGMGWSFEGFRVDAAVLRRSIERAGRPTSFDDRLVSSLTFPL